MQQRLIELHQQRGRLLERIGVQRNALSQHLVPLDRALDVGDRVARMVQDTKAFVLRHPLAITAVVITIAMSGAAEYRVSTPGTASTTSSRRSDWGRTSLIAARFRSGVWPA